MRREEEKKRRREEKKKGKQGVKKRYRENIKCMVMNGCNC